MSTAQTPTTKIRSIRLAVRLGLTPLLGLSEGDRR